MDFLLDFTDKEINEENKRIEKFNKKVKREQLKSEERKRNIYLRQIKSENRYFSDKWHKFTTTKLLMYLILINCFIVEIYSMWVMFVLGDLSALYSLIGAVVGESVTFAIYCYKSFNETKEEQRLQFEKDKFFGADGNEELETISGNDDHSGDIPEGVIMEEDHS